MKAPHHREGKRKAGTHTSIIEGAEVILNTIVATFPDIRIQNGFIEAGIGARNQSVKIVELESVIQLTLITKATKQVFMLYGKLNARDIAKSLQANKKLRGYIVNVG